MSFWWVNNRPNELAERQLRQVFDIKIKSRSERGRDNERLTGTTNTNFYHYKFI